VACSSLQLCARCREVRLAVASVSGNKTVLSTAALRIVRPKQRLENLEQAKDGIDVGGPAGVCHVHIRKESCSAFHAC